MHVTWWEEKIVQQEHGHLHRGSSGRNHEHESLQEHKHVKCTFACIWGNVCISKRSRQQRDTEGISACEHACTPKGQPALLRFNSFSHCHCSEVNVLFLLKIKSGGAHNPPNSSSSHINEKFSLEQ